MATDTFSSYPYTTTVYSAQETIVQHESDGFKVTFPSGMFSANASIRISKVSLQPMLYLRQACTQFFCWKIEWLSGGTVSGSRATWSIGIPYKSSLDSAKGKSSFNVYKDNAGAISDTDPGAWIPAPTKGSQVGYSQYGSFSGDYFRTGSGTLNAFQIQVGISSYVHS
ncbi:MAG: hypothetical protein FJ087_21555 [Deltaproteobacteria bacterium]|nr:hypothetical protein [Deltaproteobacteria bacterium]